MLFGADMNEAVEKRSSGDDDGGTAIDPAFLQRKSNGSAVLDEAEAFRKSVRIKGRVNIRKLIEEGRR